MATAGAYKSTGIKFHRQRDTADVSKVRRTFLRESENFLEECCFSSGSWLFTKDVNVFCTEPGLPELPGLQGFSQLSCALSSYLSCSLSSLSDSSPNSRFAFFDMPSDSFEWCPCLPSFRFLLTLLVVEPPRDLCYFSVISSAERKSSRKVILKQESQSRKNRLLMVVWPCMRNPLPFADASFLFVRTGERREAKKKAR